MFKKKLFIIALLVLSSAIQSTLLSLDKGSKEVSWDSTKTIPLSYFFLSNIPPVVNHSNDTVLAIDGSILILFDKNGVCGEYIKLEKAIICAAFSYDHSFIVACLIDGKVVVMDYFGKILKSYLFDDTISSVCITNDDRSIVLGSIDGRVFIVNLYTDEIIIAGSKRKTAWGTIQKINPPVKHQSKVKAIGINPKGFIVSVSADAVKFWDAYGFFKKGFNFKYTPFPISLCLHNDSSQDNIFGFVDYGKLLFYNFLGKKILKILIKDNTFNTCAINKQGTMVLAGTLDGYLYIWDIKGCLIKRQYVSESGINALAISGDDSFIVISTGTDGMFILQKN